MKAYGAQDYEQGWCRQGRGCCTGMQHPAGGVEELLARNISVKYWHTSME